jgi:phage-related protein
MERYPVMFEVNFYEDAHGRQPVREVLVELRGKSDDNKGARIQYEKILAYLLALETFGTRIGAPKVKHLDGDLWELRPMAHRIIFFYWKNGTFILLHHFIKKTRKTPPREIGRARKNMTDFLTRSGDNGENTK